MRVLLSIKPEFALRIFEGTKKYEYRRAIFKRREVRKVVVYASDPIKRIIGEFEIGEILYDNPENLWTATKDNAGICEKRFLKYFTDKPKGYAIQIKSAKKYKAPLRLESFMLSSPPRSFFYL